MAGNEPSAQEQQQAYCWGATPAHMDHVGLMPRILLRFESAPLPTTDSIDLERHSFLNPAPSTLYLPSLLERREL